MRRRWVVAFCWAIVLVSAREACAGPMTIKLKDGTVLRGDVLSKEGAYYKVDSGASGMLLINESDIVTMEQAPASAQPLSGAAGSSAPSSVPPASAPSSVPPARVEAYRNKILGNSLVMGEIQELARDKSIQELVMDEELRSAVMRQDFEYLENSEKFQQFVNNPSVQQIVNQVASSLDNSP